MRHHRATTIQDYWIDFRTVPNFLLPACRHHHYFSTCLQPAQCLYGLYDKIIYICQQLQKQQTIAVRCFKNFLFNADSWSRQHIINHYFVLQQHFNWQFTVRHNLEWSEILCL
ncbi:unnamed protein product [Blepharisma stoltei]|uniref:Uncharacterized protein n=1 Tax=Blepharisma stoltei TaxID=1481888 RepID=A0AAU9JG88_9CILI|nr:unnamed protein product [Blepharisma stoltei]